MKTNKLTRTLYSSAAILMMLSPMVGSVAGTMVHAEEPKLENNADKDTFKVRIHKYGSLNDEKYKDTQKHISDATEEDAVKEEYTPLNGITFTLQSVKPTNEEKGLKSIDITKPNTYEAVGTPIQMTTEGNGVAEKDVPKGVYIVKEEKSDFVEAPAADSLIQIPFAKTDSEGKVTGYLNEIDIYPKNKLPEAKEDDKVTDKTVKKTIDFESSEIKLGGNITWNLKTIVPSSAKVQAEAKLSITDQLNKHLEYVGITGYIVPKNQEFNNENVGSYTKLNITDDFTINNDNNKVTVDFTPAGLIKAAGLNVVFQLTAKVATLADDGEITNTIDVTYTPGTNGGTEEKGKTPEIKPDPEDPDKDPKDPNTNTAQFGTLDIKKIASDTKKPLKGAEFKVYQLTKEAKEKKAKGEKVEISMDNLEPYKLGGSELVMVTQENGVATAKGVEAYNDYYFEEIKAPAGYKKVDDKIYSTENGVEYDGEDKEEIEATITNDVDPIYNIIPMTGSQRRIALMAMGATIAVSSMLYVYAQKRRKDEEEEQA